MQIDETFFRESISKPCNELYDAGYIDKKDYALMGNVVTKLRFSEFLPFEKVSQHIFRLREFYNVGYLKKPNYNNKVMILKDNKIKNEENVIKYRIHWRLLWKT